MPKRSIRIDYTLYSPGHRRGSGLCLDFETLARAKKFARTLGDGTTIIRNFNLRGPKNEFDWWQEGRCWYLVCKSFFRMDSVMEKKWVVVPEHTKRPHPVKGRELLTARQRNDIIRRLRHLSVMRSDHADAERGIEGGRSEEERVDTQNGTEDFEEFGEGACDG